MCWLSRATIGSRTLLTKADYQHRYVRLPAVGK
jgi:hypothetical protein